MSKLTVASSNETKVVSLNAQKNLFTISDFFAAYGNHTNQVMLALLITLFKEYKKSQAYQYLSFGEKVDVEFQFEVMRKLIRDIRR